MGEEEVATWSTGHKRYVEMRQSSSHSPIFSCSWHYLGPALSLAAEPCLSRRPSSLRGRRRVA